MGTTHPVRGLGPAPPSQMAVVRLRARGLACLEQDLHHLSRIVLDMRKERDAQWSGSLGDEPAEPGPRLI